MRRKVRRPTFSTHCENACGENLISSKMFLVGIILFHLGLKTAQAIDCFKCISMNKDYPPCEDPFHNNFTVDIYESPCMGGRKGRDGVFPATSCVKITGTFEDNEETIMIRGCALDSGTLTTDTELVRMSHCGAFYYDNRYVRGCVQTCNDADACNNSFEIRSSFKTALLTMVVSAIILTP